jgi:hypothetical protein
MVPPESPTPFADRIGMAPSAFDVMVAGLGSIAINGLACCLMIFGTHHPRTTSPSSSKPTSQDVEQPKPVSVVQVLTEIVKPADRRTRVELEDLHRAYLQACQAQGVPVAGVQVFGAHAKAFAEAAGIRVLSSDGKLFWCGVKLAA